MPKKQYGSPEFLKEREEYQRERASLNQRLEEAAQQLADHQYHGGPNSAIDTWGNIFCSRSGEQGNIVRRFMELYIQKPMDLSREALKKGVRAKTKASRAEYEDEARYWATEAKDNSIKLESEAASSINTYHDREYAAARIVGRSVLHDAMVRHKGCWLNIRNDNNVLYEKAQNLLSEVENYQTQRYSDWKLSRQVKSNGLGQTSMKSKLKRRMNLKLSPVESPSVDVFANIFKGVPYEQN